MLENMVGTLSLKDFSYLNVSKYAKSRKFSSKKEREITAKNMAKLSPRDGALRRLETLLVYTVKNRQRLLVNRHSQSLPGLP